MTHTITDNRPIAPAEAPKSNFLQRAAYIHMLRDCINILDCLHTAPVYTHMLRVAIEGYLTLSIRSANKYRLPVDFDSTKHPQCQPFQATINHILDIANLTSNQTLDDESACGIIYTRTAHLLAALYPADFECWRTNAGDKA